MGYRAIGYAAHPDPVDVRILHSFHMPCGARPGGTRTFGADKTQKHKAARHQLSAAWSPAFSVRNSCHAKRLASLSGIPNAIRFNAKEIHHRSRSAHSHSGMLRCINRKHHFVIIQHPVFRQPTTTLKAFFQNDRHAVPSLFHQELPCDFTRWGLDRALCQ